MTSGFFYRLLIECSHTIELAFKVIQCVVNAQIALVLHSVNIRTILHQTIAVIPRLSQCYSVITLPILTLDLILTQRNSCVRSDPMRNVMLNQHWISIHHLLMRNSRSLVPN